MSKIVLLKGIIGRGINGVCEIRITTDDDIPLTNEIVSFKGEIKGMDLHFKDHPLAGQHLFTVKTKDILAIIE